MVSGKLLELVAAAAVLGLAAARPQGYEQQNLPVVDLGYELHKASAFNTTGQFYNFSNIRFAAPPVGKLRFAPPQAPERNRREVNTGGDARICPQAQPAWGNVANNFLIASVLGAPFNASQPIPRPNSTTPLPKQDPRTSEDCLFLDVFAPKDALDNAGKKKQGVPVLVWIYGGGYTAGSKQSYDFAGIMSAGVNGTDGRFVLVAMNYRLGALGWSSGPSYQAEGGAANLGLLDQRFALEWVQKNIHLFGGDPRKVTVFGESAGGGSIMHQITAYGGLKGKVPFQRAIPQSPGWQPVTSQQQQEATYKGLLEVTNTTSLAELRALSSDEIIRANWLQIARDSPWGSYTYGPTVDGSFVPQLPGQLLAQGRFDSSVKVMVGHNAREGTYFTPPYINDTASLDAQLRIAFPHVADDQLSKITGELYPAVYNGSHPYTTPFGRAELLLSEGVFTCNTYYISKALKNQTYSYLFAVPPAFHGLDLPYTFYDGGAVNPLNPLGVANLTVALALQDYITSFAVNGKPTTDEPGVMVKFDMYGPDAQVLKLNVTGIEEVRDSNANERCNYWQKGLFS